MGGGAVARAEGRCEEMVRTHDEKPTENQQELKERKKSEGGILFLSRSGPDQRAPGVRGLHVGQFMVR